MAEASSETSIKGGEKYNVKVRWAIPQKLNQMTFVGKDVFAVAHDIYIIFITLKANSELVYVANSEATGDGVDVITGHKANIFAFAEKTTNARIFVVTYPSFNIFTKLQDMTVNRYKGLCLMECDLIAGFTGFPNYLISVWCWRTNHKLISIPTGVIRRSQLYMASRTHMLVCQCWGQGINVWEVAQCFKKCLIMKRSKEEKVGWEVSDPVFVDICWTLEGHLYAIDANAHLYSLCSDGINMIHSMEWGDESHYGSHDPKMCAFGNGLLIYGPDKYLRALKKVASSKWKVTFTFTPKEPVARLVGNSTCDLAAAWTQAGLLYKITGESEEKVEVTPVFYKQRNIQKIQMIAPDYKYLATMNDEGVLCFYEMSQGKLVLMRHVQGHDVSFSASPTEPIVAVFGSIEQNYGVSLYRLQKDLSLVRVARMCLTHQLVSRVVFSSTGRELVAAAMSAGHLFILKLTDNYALHLVRYSELGRGLADTFLMKVGESMRSFSLVLFSDKYLIGERIVCINAENGKDNKFAGKMQGPYCRLLPLWTPDMMVAVPHLSRQYHVLKLSGDKGVTVTVKIFAIIESGHDIKQFDGFYGPGSLLTCGFDGHLVLRKPDASKEYDLKFVVSHRYEAGVEMAVVDISRTTVAHLGGNRACAVTALCADRGLKYFRSEHGAAGLDLSMLDEAKTITIFEPGDITYLDLQEEKKVHEETMDFRRQREELVTAFKRVQKKVVELLEENIAEVPLHQLSLSEFNLHLEHRKERKMQAEREREEIRLTTEALIHAQDKVTLWIKNMCWDTMLSPRVKIFAIFSHYQVENFGILPTQRDTWPELKQTEALRLLEMEHEADVFRPWEEAPVQPAIQPPVQQGVQPAVQPASAERPPVHRDVASRAASRSESLAPELASDEEEEETAAQPYVLAGSLAHRFVPVPPYAVPQTRAFSYLHMNWMQHVVKLTVQNMRIWFNKQFDELMTLKKREVGLVADRNARLRFIIEELNKLSDLRGSFHHLMIEVKDPQWTQEEQPLRLIKVDPEECAVTPYISPSQIVIIPPDPGPKDDFRERALIEMMDGVLEKLWHEEIKKPIPVPQCMLDKEPEHFNEEDLRQVFDYEAKVAFRNEERDKYRKMLHAEYAKLSQVLNEGIVKFNHRVKEMRQTKLKVDSVIGQENLNMMRLRRTNLDRLEMAEKLESMRESIKRYEGETEVLLRELQSIQEQSAEVQATYEALSVKDKFLERSFKNHFTDLSPIIVDQCYKFFKKRPKWQQRASMIPVVLYELCVAVLTGTRPTLLHHDCLDYFRAVEQLDQLSNMPPVMDEGLWVIMCKLRRAKIENEIRMRGVALEMGYVEGTLSVWNKAVAARRAELARTADSITHHRHDVEFAARNRTVQLVLPAGQVEIVTTGHMEDFDDAALVPRQDIEAINNLILKVGAMKLRMMRAQMEFRKGILAKEWEHAQMKMKLRHMTEELYSYERLRIPKELQLYLKNKELGYTEEMEFVRMEKEMEASKFAVNKFLAEEIHRVEELQMKIKGVEAKMELIEKFITKLNVKVSEKRLNEDPLEPIRVRRLLKERMDTLVMRSHLIRTVQANHTTIVMLQTELELLRLKTYPTLACFQTYN